MLANGTFPVPIVVAVNFPEVVHPRGNGVEKMAKPLQLLEGERRLGFLHAMDGKGIDCCETHGVIEVCT